MALTAFRRIQIGKEATRGTGVAATKKLVGTLTMTPSITMHSPVDERNSLAEFRRDVPVAQGATLRFTGSAIYQQLVDFLGMALKGSVAPASATPTGAKYDDNGIFANMTNALDDNVVTEHSFAGFVAAQDKVYVRAAATFRAVKCTVGTTPNAAASTISAVEVSDGAGGWIAATLVRDGTLASGASLAQTGIIEFTVPSTWLSDTVDGDAGFWVRFTWSGNWTAGADISELDTVPIVTVWTFTPNLTSRNNQDAYTVEYGDDSQEFETTFGLVSALELAITLGDVVTLNVDMFARFPSKSTFTAALSDPTVNEIVSNHLRVYIDGSWATLGNTQKSSLVMGGTVRMSTGAASVKYADGSLDFSNFIEQRRHLEIELEMAVGADAITEYDAWVAQTLRAIRLEWTGPTLGGGNYKLTVDAIGRYTSGPEFLADKDGQNVMRFIFQTREDSLGNEMSFVVQNNVAVL